MQGVRTAPQLSMNTRGYNLLDQPAPYRSFDTGLGANATSQSFSSILLHQEIAAGQDGLHIPHCGQIVGHWAWYSPDSGYSVESVLDHFWLKTPLEVMSNYKQLRAAVIEGNEDALKMILGTLRTEWGVIIAAVRSSRLSREPLLIII